MVEFHRTGDVLNDQIMNAPKSYSFWPTTIIISAIVLLGIAGAIIPSLPAKLLALACVLFAAIGIFDCINSEKATNTKLLWILLIIIAPLLGSLCWFFWGKHQS